ncbi:unnamed protein product [Discosporangium mesarthrocarpum]
MRHAKAHLLEPGFTSIPASAEVWAFCCESPELARMSNLLPYQDPSGPHFKLPTGPEWAHCQGASSAESMQIPKTPRGAVSFRRLSGDEMVWEFDFTSLPPLSGRRRELSFPILADGVVHAVVYWWRCHMDASRETVLTTEPGKTADPPPDHWRQAVFLLSGTVQVRAGSTFRAVAVHDEDMIWFEAVNPEPGSGMAVGRSGIIGGGGEQEGPEQREGRGSQEKSTIAVDRGASSTNGDHKGWGTDVGDGWAGGVGAGAGPPVCTCGLHATADRNRIWMLNDSKRTGLYRSALRKLLSPPPTHPALGSLAAASATTSTSRGVHLCVSDSFLLPLLAAQEGAVNIHEVACSPLAQRVSQRIYTANSVWDRVVTLPCPPGPATYYDLLCPEPRSPPLVDVLGGKVDTVIGEPYFSDLAQSWPGEALLLFWCVRTALEAGGCFTPRTRVLPARAYVMASAVECAFLFQAHQAVGEVQGVDMSAINLVNGKGGGGSELASFRLWEYRHLLLSPPVNLLEVNLNQPLHDISSKARVDCESDGGGEEGQGARECHGLVLWLDLCLDEGGDHRVTTGPEAPYWRQGFSFFEEAWVVPPGGGCFDVLSSIKDGALQVRIG